MSQIAAIGAVALLFAAFALLHRRVEARGCSDTNTDGCESCSHHSDCRETRDVR